MIGYKVIYLLIFISPVLSEDKLFLEKPKEQSYFSKISSWLFPEQKTEETHLAPQYLPPAKHCNPCNQSPWIPMASNLGHHTVINFQPPSSQYGPPLQNYLPSPNPKPIQFNKPIFAPSIGGMYPPPPQGGVYHSLPSNQYAPSSISYGTPSQLGVAKLPPPVYFPKRPPPPSTNYGTPINPPPSNFGKYPPSAPPTNYGTPINPPPSNFGNNPPSAPPTNYGTPINLPSSNFGKYPPSAPPTNYGTPIKLENVNPPPSIQDHDFEHPPPPPPSDSYGSPIPEQNLDYQIRNEYLPPLEQLPLSSETLAGPLPVPNLSRAPVLPLHNYQDFNEIHKPAEVQVVPSINVADFVSSIEHPINIIQSPLVEVRVSQNQSNNDEEGHVRPGGFYGSLPRLSDNPIVVDDSHAAASTVNTSKVPTSKNIIKDILKSESKSTFTPPSLDYTKWEPFESTTTVLPTSMVPPTPGPSTWFTPETATKKHIQIIIPYTNNKKPQPFEGKYSTLHPVYSPPLPSSDMWTKFMQDFNLAESQRVTATAFTSSTQVYNIQDLLKGTKQYQPLGRVPFDVISLQNNIDDWTQQEYSKSLKHNNGGKSGTVKKIPDDFFTTAGYNNGETSTSDYEGASSNHHENDLDSKFDTDGTTTEEVSTTTAATPQKDEKSLWDSKSVTISPVTNEKVYVVTPQTVGTASTEISVEGWSMPPQISLKNESNIPKFLIRVDPEDKSSRDKLLKNAGPLTVVFSEWPHLINNLQTTKKPPSGTHPLLGLMGYTPPVNATVQTITGHSKVVTVVTPASTKLRRVSTT